jgi:hypothetical protein
MLVTHLLYFWGYSVLKRMNKAMEKLTFEQLPVAVATLLEKVTRIEELLSSGIPGELTTGQMLTTAEAAHYMGISLSSVYKLTSHKGSCRSISPTVKRSISSGRILTGIFPVTDSVLQKRSNRRQSTM